jgi:hypothetical protein
VKAQQSRKIFLQWAGSLIKPAFAPLLVFVIHLIAYTVFRQYQMYPLFDIPMHFLGGLAMAYFLDKAYVNASLMSGALGNWPIRSLLVFTSTCTVAVFWEFGEFVLAWNASTNLQRGLAETMGLADTMKDLFFGMTGSVFYIAGVGLSNKTASRVVKLETNRGDT